MGFDDGLADADQPQPTPTPSPTAIFPRLRVGRRWLNLLWVLPAVMVLLLIAVVAAQYLRSLTPVRDFISEYPGTVLNAAEPGFPWWLRAQHFLNALFLIPIVRSGLQIWSGRPRVYWRRSAERGREWLRIQRAVSTSGPTWPIRDDATGLPPNVGLPGPRSGTPLGRAWHLGVTLLWVLNGIVFYVLIFATGQWQRIVPTSLDVFPNAASAILQYASLDFPPNEAWVAYNGIQLLTYFVTVFIAAPLAVITGLLHSPRLQKRLKNSRFLNLEVIRSVHVITLGWFIVFVILHVTLVLVTGAAQNLNTMTFGTNDTGWAGLILFAAVAVIVAVLWILASPATLRYPRIVGFWRRLIGPLRRFY